MRKQIAAANWKMNLTYQAAEKLLDEILKERPKLGSDQQVIFAVPFPYLTMAKSEVAEEAGYDISAQNCHQKGSGAYTGEVSAEMLKSLGIKYCILGHSERREYFGETSALLEEKIRICLDHNISPIFCCGEPLAIREKETQNDYVRVQLEEALFNFTEDELSRIIIAYEPIWAIGTGRTASAEQAQEMHAHIRSVLSTKFGQEAAERISILYGGSVKASNAAELFNLPDVDGGLVGGASLVAQDFLSIIKALKL